MSGKPPLLTTLVDITKVRGGDSNREATGTGWIGKDRQHGMNRCIRDEFKAMTVWSMVWSALAVASHNSAVWRFCHVGWQKNLDLDSERTGVSRRAPVADCV